MSEGGCTAEIVLLPGDGIGPEVVAAAQRVLEAVSRLSGHSFRTVEYLIGGKAIDLTGTALPEETLAACRRADAILLGAVGGPRWDNPAASVRPEQGLLGLRKALDLFGNLRPVRPYPELASSSPLRPEFLEGVDLLVVRELTGDVYFGEPRLRRLVKNGSDQAEEQAIDTMSYTVSEVRRVAHLAFRLARARRRKVTSVDKANVLESSRLWRQVITQVAGDYPDVQLDHLLVDAAAMFLVTRPAEFDVLLTGNLFGDILTDEASVLSGSMGVLPSASLGDGLNSLGLPRGLYEPIHGSAPDIAGQGIANPVGTILSAAMLLRHSLGMEAEARAVEAAVQAVIAAGLCTPDLGGQLSTSDLTEAIVTKIGERVSSQIPTNPN
jgi:3-isopropylmalate dehydrogenase